jgi:hypothetical protein
VSNPSAPAAIAAALTAFVDVLIPGDADFPPASAAGTHGIVFNRVRQQLGNAAFARIAAALDGGESFADASPEHQVAVVAELEQNDPDLFAFLRFATYFAYYETPPVIAALQRLGHDYHDSPQPLGYELPPFDRTKHLPAVPRGSYKGTAEITRLDLSALADLDLPVREGSR